MTKARNDPVGTFTNTMFVMWPLFVALGIVILEMHREPLHPTALSRSAVYALAAAIVGFSFTAAFFLITLPKKDNPFLTKIHAESAFAAYVTILVMPAFLGVIGLLLYSLGDDDRLFEFGFDFTMAWLAASLLISSATSFLNALGVLLLFVRKMRQVT